MNLEMNKLIKNIIREETNQNELFLQGIDIAISILKKDYPFIIDWEIKNEWTSFTEIDLICDINKTSEFYDSPIIPGSLSGGDRSVPYPHWLLDIRTKLNEDENFALYRGIRNDLNEIYDEIPGEFKRLFGTSKSIYLDLTIDRFKFVNPKNLEESFETINEDTNQNELFLQGIDITISILKKDYPFILDWELKNEHNTFADIQLLCDNSKPTELYESPIGEYFEMYSDLISGSDSTLHLDWQTQREPSYEIYKKINEDFKEIYDELPSDFKKIPKYVRVDFVQIFIDSLRFIDSKNNLKKNINESKDRPNYLGVIEKLVTSYKDREFVCDVEVLYDEEDDFYVVTLWFDPEQMGERPDFYVKNLRKELTTEIKNYLPIDNIYVGSGGNVGCSKKRITENKIPSSDYNSLEKVMNMVMGEKYDWWKDIKINNITHYSDYNNYTNIGAKITVDEDWGGNQWNEYNPHMEFPGNKGWEDNEEYELVSLGDIIGLNLANEIRETISEVLKYTLGIEINTMSFRNLMLIFE